MKKHSFIILILFFCLNNISAKLHLHEMKKFGEGEMTSNLINQILQDSNGFIWVATDYGLNKFDGSRFTQYLHDESDSTSLLSNNIRSLMIDRNNILWIGSNSGLQYYEPNTNSFKKISFPNIESLHIAGIIELYNGDIWAITSGNGTFSINKSSCTARYLDKITQITDKFPNYIYEDIDHNIWIGIIGNGIVRINPYTSESIHFLVPDLPHENITAIVEDKEQLYLSTHASVCRFDKYSQKFILMDNPEGAINITTMTKSKDGTIYLTTEGQGLKYVDRELNRISTVMVGRVPYDYKAVRINALFEDKDSNLWLGCFQKGIFMIPKESTQFDFWGITMDEKHRMGNRIVSIYKDHENSIWCSVMKEGLLKLNNRGEVIDKFNELDHVTMIYEDSGNELWISSYYSKGLAKLNKTSGKCQFANIPFEGYLKSMVEGLDKNLYISVFGSGFIRYNPKTGSWKQYSMIKDDKEKGKLDNDWINNIICDSQGLIWLGHYKGLSCYDPTSDRFIEIPHGNIFSEQICLSLMEGSNGNIWIGTYNGLFCIDTKKSSIKTYTTKDGLSNNVICGLSEDESGNIWCSTFKGINQIKIKDNHIINYYIGNGLVDKIYNRGVYCQGSDGTIYFGGDMGITSFLPKNISPLEDNYKVLTTNVYVQNKPITSATLSGGKHIIETGILTANKFRFANEDNSFTFEFSTMDYKDPENIFYQYRLKELSENWSTTQPGISQITYNHLPTGKFTLEVRACKYGAFTPIKQLIIEVDPPWYRSTLAYIFYLFMIILLGTLIFHLIRKKRIEQKNESKLRFFIDISHEIRSPLTLIISPMEKLMKGDYDDTTMKILHNMYRNANRILGLVNQLLDIRKIDKEQMRLKYSETDLIGFIKEIFEVFEYQTHKRNIHFEFRHSIDRLIVWIDRNNFDKILINLLSNAFKYTPDNGEIIISLSVGKNNKNKGALHDYVEIAILDSGIGINENEAGKIFDRFYQGHKQETFTTIGSGIGLNLTQMLIQLHQGTIRAQNRKDKKGSCFTIRIPLGKDHLKKEDIVEHTTNTNLIKKEPFYHLDSYTEKGKKTQRKTNYKILIVDDEEEIRNYLKQELADTYKIIVADNGETGLKLTISQQPDLIISDVKMPQMDGFTFVKKLKSNNNTSHIPLILLTSKIEYEDRMEGLGKGADAYLTKPFNVEELLITVNNLISNRRILKGKFSGAQDQTDKVKSVEFKSSNDLLMERVMIIINENIDNPALNVEMLASKIGLSRVQLHRKIKEITSISTGDFIRNIRLKQAALLLREKKMNISQVAYAVGFANQTHFSTLFKKNYGMSPTEYIAHHSGDN